MGKRLSIIDMFNDIKRKKTSNEDVKPNEQQNLPSPRSNPSPKSNNLSAEDMNIINSQGLDSVNKRNSEGVDSFNDRSSLRSDDNKNVPDANRYSFLTNIKDANGIPKGHENYDPTTLLIPTNEYKKFTPFEKQFWDIKRNYFDTIIFFKKGKFYELYEEDAEIANREFDMKVTERVNMKMSGFPESSYDTWANKFLQKGYKIGRVEQRENQLGKKIRESASSTKKTSSKEIIERELKEIITQGTIYNNDHLSSALPVFISVITQAGGGYNILLYDASVNKMYFRTQIDMSDIKGIFIENCIKEVITDGNIEIKGKEYTCINDSRIINNCNEKECSEVFAGISGDPILLENFKYLYSYFNYLNRKSILISSSICRLTNLSKSMTLDGCTIENMDLLQNNYDCSTSNTLFSRINYCNTPFGTRLLKKWMLTPLVNKDLIVERRRGVSDIGNLDFRSCVDFIKKIGDVERYFAKLNNNSVTVKDVAKLIDSLIRSNDFLKQTQTIDKINAYKLTSNIIDSFYSNYSISDNSIQPVNQNDELFRLTEECRAVEKELKEYLNKIEKIVGQNLSFKSINKDLFQIEAESSIQMPEGFYVNSCTKSTKRYYSRELIGIVNRYKEAEEMIFQSQGGLLSRAVSFIKKYTIEINIVINFIAHLDCYMSYFTFNQIFATVPYFVENTTFMNISGLTNPIYPNYIKNDFKPESNICILTGPNMGGKSTFLRSFCLNVILAQMGLNVAADKFQIPFFDKIHTRIGASDSLARGESTFMMEMNETAKILNNATSKTLVIMDELGRGTSTKDGEAIARAVLDHLRETGCFTIFSTHYHNLCKSASAGLYDQYYVKCLVENENITFLYKIGKGVCMDSHGLYVAKLANIPDHILERAKTIRASLLKKN